jgi:hypothetical protein
MQIDGYLKVRGVKRPHYVVEKRYRSTLNEKYAALARTLPSEAIQRICKTESRDWALNIDGIASGSKSREGDAQRQRKTATLSATIETITLLSRCCNREARELERLRESVQDIVNRVQNVLEAKSPLDNKHSSA